MRKFSWTTLSKKRLLSGQKAILGYVQRNGRVTASAMLYYDTGRLREALERQQHNDEKSMSCIKSWAGAADGPPLCFGSVEDVARANPDHIPVFLYRGEGKWEEMPV